MKSLPVVFAAAIAALTATMTLAEPDNTVSAETLPGGLAPSLRGGPDEQAIKDYYQGPRGQEW